MLFLIFEKLSTKNTKLLSLFQGISILLMWYLVAVTHMMLYKGDSEEKKCSHQKNGRKLRKTLAVTFVFATF